jgi:Phospholipase_D-nuclease N-terminal
MLFFDGTLALVFMALWLFCLLDVITAPEDSVRNLPKIAWVFIVILLFELGAIAWLIAGRPRAGARDVRAATGRTPTSTGARKNPDDDEEFLAGLRARAEEQRRRARHQDDRPESS